MNTAKKRAAWQGGPESTQKRSGKTAYSTGLTLGQKRLARSLACRRHDYMTEVFADAALDDGEKVLAARIAVYVFGDQWLAFPARAELARATCTGERTVSRRLARLIQRGYLHVIPRNNAPDDDWKRLGVKVDPSARTNLYALALPTHGAGDTRDTCPSRWACATDGGAGANQPGACATDGGAGATCCHAESSISESFILESHILESDPRGTRAQNASANKEAKKDESDGRKEAKTEEKPWEEDDPNRDNPLPPPFQPWPRPSELIAKADSDESARRLVGEYAAQWLGYDQSKSAWILNELDECRLGDMVSLLQAGHGLPKLTVALALMFSRVPHALDARADEGS